MFESLGVKIMALLWLIFTCWWTANPKGEPVGLQRFTIYISGFLAGGAIA